MDYKYKIIYIIFGTIYITLLYISSFIKRVHIYACSDKNK